jgi:hypothetical protein
MPKAAREKSHVVYKSEPTRITEESLAETIKVRRPRNDVFQALKRNNCQPRLLYPAKLSFKTEREIKPCQDKLKLKLLSQHYRRYLKKY